VAKAPEGPWVGSVVAGDEFAAGAGHPDRDVVAEDEIVQRDLEHAIVAAFAALLDVIAKTFTRLGWEKSSRYRGAGGERAGEALVGSVVAGDEFAAGAGHPDRDVVGEDELVQRDLEPGDRERRRPRVGHGDGLRAGAGEGVADVVAG
jgi:hypothetical protein